MNTLRPLVARIKHLEEQLAKTPAVRWGVVTSTSPLRVRYEEDSLPLLGSPSSLVHSSMLRVGQRVELLVQNGRPVIQGIGGGDATEWVTIAPASPFRLYSGGHLEISREGRQVYFRGAVSTDTANLIDGYTSETFAHIPYSEYRPSRTEFFVCEGSSKNRWVLAVSAGGVVSATRYGPGEQPAGVWMPFSVSWRR